MEEWKIGRWTVDDTVIGCEMTEDGGQGASGELRMAIRRSCILRLRIENGGERIGDGEMDYNNKVKINQRKGRILK